MGLQGLIHGATGLLLAAACAGAAAFSLEDRVGCQRAIERVLWQHRGEAATREAFERAVPEAVIRRRAEDAERQTLALAQWWQTPIEPAQLQAELDRMAAGSRDPGVLRELFAALGHDPLRAAECLARPALADRLLRARFARDERIHGERRRQVQAEHRAGQATTAERQSHRWAIDRTALAEAGPGARLLEPGAFARQAEQLRRAATQPDGRLALGQRGRLREEADRWVSLQVDAVAPRVLRSQATVWRKTPLTTWWQQARRGLSQPLGVVTSGYRLPTLAEGSCRDDSWRPTLSHLDGRYEHTAAWTGSEMIVWGGMEAVGVYYNDGARYQPATDTWRAMSATDAPSARHALSSAWTGSEFLVWGGTASNVGGRYDPATDTWRAMGTSGAPAEGHSWAASVWTGRELIVWGGLGGATGQALASGARYDPKTDRWTALPPAPLAARAYMPATWTGQEMVIWSGYDVGRGALYADGARYDPASNTWRPVSGSGAPAGNYWHTAVWSGREVITFGGVVWDSLARAYDPASNQWRPLSTTGMPAWRYLHGAVWTGEAMLVQGGWPSNQAGGLYDPLTDQWRATSTSQAFPGTQAGTLVWTGSEALHWGGLDDQFSYHADGARYSPSADRWQPMTTMNVPHARAMHAGEWTGAEMVIWGGYDGVGVTDSGARYLPATDTWTPMSTAGAATARASATSVWTGQDIIFWGAGSSAPFTPDTGGIYNPATDRWRPMSNRRAPWVTYGHTAVWTGSEMITYGGISSSDGAYAYHLGSDSWRRATLQGDPGHRDHHGAVWSGQEMIVWGGSIDAGITPTGGRYDPVANRWTALPLTGSPEARMWPVAVWTGQEALFWGGYDQLFGRDFNDGARFSPATGQWQAMRLEGAPSPRVGQGVFTGSELVVWGGRADRSGGRYDVASDQWRPTTLLNAPEGRAFGGRWSTVFTGQQMVIWGGFGPTQQGASYCLSGAPNVLPTAQADRYKVRAGKRLVVGPAAGLLANDADANGDPLSVRLVNPPAGTLGLNANGSFSYHPPPGFTGTDSFRYEVRDDLAPGGTATVRIQVR